LVVGVDTDMASIETLRGIYSGSERVRLFCMDICSDQARSLDRFALDTAISINVLEHVEDDVCALANMGDLVVPGGYVITIVPAHPWLYGSIDRAIGHLRRYDKASMAAALTRAHLVPVMQKYINLAGALGWFVNSRLLRKSVPPTDQLKAFNRMVPLLRRLEQAIPVPVGISLLTIARKAE